MTNIQERSGYPLGRTARLLLGAWSLLLLCGFAVAAGLEPDPRGYGTHQALGFPPCTFRELLGIPCPSCGMTTSVSNYVRGRFGDAARANCGGFVLATLGLVQIPWCWASIYSKRLWGIDQPAVVLFWMLIVVCGMTLLQWLWRVF
jgi:hypothetical protein